MFLLAKARPQKRPQKAFPQKALVASSTVLYAYSQWKRRQGFQSACSIPLTIIITVVSTPVINIIITLSLPGKSTYVHCSPPLAIIVTVTNQRPHHNLFYSTGKAFENTYLPLTFSTFKYKYDIIIRILNIYQIFSIKYDVPPPPGKSSRPHVHCSLSQDTSHKVLPPRYGSCVTMIFF